MTRIGQRVLVQRVEDLVVLIDESSDNEIVLTYEETLAAIRAMTMFALHIDVERT